MGEIDRRPRAMPNHTNEQEGLSRREIAGAFLGALGAATLAGCVARDDTESGDELGQAAQGLGTNIAGVQNVLDWKVPNQPDHIWIQKAIDDSPDGSTLLFPPGTYTLGAGLQVKKALHLVGAGPAATLLLKEVNDGQPILKVEPQTGDIRGFRLAHIMLQGSNSPSVDFDGVRCKLLVEGENTIEDVHIRACAWGISLEQVFGMGIANCRIEGNYAGGIRAIPSGASGDTNQITLHNLWVKLNLGPALDIATGKWTVIGGAYENPDSSAPLTTDNILIRGWAYSVTLVGVYVENARRSNVRVLGVQDGQAATPRAISLLGCYINNSQTDSPNVYLGDCRGVVIDNCLFEGGDTPIEVKPAAKEVTIRNLQVQNGATPPIVSSSASVTIEHPGIWVPLGALTSSTLVASVYGGAGVELYPAIAFPAGEQHDVVATIPLPPELCRAGGRLRVTIFTQSSTGSPNGYIAWRFRAKVITSPLDRIYDTTGTVEGTVSPWRSVQVQRNVFSTTIPTIEGGHLLRLQLSRMASAPFPSYPESELLLAMMVDRAS